MERVLEVPVAIGAEAMVSGDVEKGWPVRNVLGYLPGTHSYDFCADCLGKRLIVVLARYDSPPVGPDGIVYPAADDNASGVAVMLEAIRVLQETDYEPYKTFLFIAYSGEGLEGGESVSDPDIARFLQARAGLSQHELEAVVHLRGLGGRDGKRLAVSAQGSLRLAQLFERSARQMGVDARRANEGIDIGVIYDQSASFHEGGQDAPVVRLYRDGWRQHAHLPADTIEVISVDSLTEAGRTLALSLMILGRETAY
jgi:hypothetical protein